MTRLYLDANVFIHAVEERHDDDTRLFAEKLVRAGLTGLLECVTCELTLAEVLAPNRRSGAMPADVRRAYLSALVWQHGIRLEALTRTDMYKSAEVSLIQKSRVRLPDRLHLSVAIRLGATHFVTNDKAIRTPQPMTKLRLTASDMRPILAEVRF